MSYATNTLDIRNVFGIETSVSPNFDNWVEALLALNKNGIEGIREAVWEASRHANQMPRYADLFQQIVLSRLADAFVDRIVSMYSHIDGIKEIANSAVGFVVNGTDSEFYVLDKPVTTYAEIMNGIRDLTREYPPF